MKIQNVWEQKMPKKKIRGLAKKMSKVGKTVKKWTISLLISKWTESPNWITQHLIVALDSFSNIGSPAVIFIFRIGYKIITQVQITSF